jgi:N-dimethylarginine dimethylaminohydrolase
MLERARRDTAIAWQLDSETGLLREALLCRPDHYAWRPINAIAAATMARGDPCDVAAAQAQHAELAAALAEAGVACRWLEPEPHLTSQVFTRDSGLVTPWGPVIPQLARRERRGEYAAVLRLCQQHGQPPWAYVTRGTVEGGDVHLIRPGLLLVGHAERTDADGAGQLAAWFEAASWTVRLQPFPAHCLHLDLLFCMAAEDLALACVEVLDDDLLLWLRQHGIRLIPVPYKEAMQLGCNVLALGGDRVVSARGSHAVNARLRAEGLTVLDPEIALFAKGGGGVHCLVMPLRRDPASASAALAAE